VPTAPVRTSAVALPGRLTASTLAATLVAALLTAAGIALAPAAHAGGGAFVSMINSARASRGLPALASSGELASVAASWSRHMASTGTLAHNPGLTAQVSGYRYVGENVGYGPDEATIHQAFMNSAAHRANILDRDYTQVGVAVVAAGGRLWVTEVFRAPTGSSRPPAASSGGSSSKPSSGPSSKPSSGSSKPATSRSKGTSTRQGSSTARSRGTSGSTAAARPGAPPPPPPSPEELLRRRAAAAVAGPGAARATDPVQQALRFVEVMRATHG
jgi:hypothetical protein